MKNLILITTITVAFSMQACSQKSDHKKVPEKVQTAFNEKFPEGKKAEWEMENDTDWEAEFNWNGKEYSASFNVNGEWLETEYEIKTSELPANILAILDQNFTDYEIEESEMVETSQGKYYEMQIKADDEEFEVDIDYNGNLTKKLEREENDEN